MIIFFSFSTVIFVFVLVAIFILSIFDTSLQIYGWLESHLYLIIIFLLIRGAASILSYVISTKKHNRGIDNKRMSIEIISNVAFIIAICLFINDMAGLTIEHHIASGICAFLSIFSIGYSLFWSINFNNFFNSDEDYFSSIFLIVTSVFVIIISLLPNSLYGWKIFLNMIIAFETVVGGKSIHD